MCYCIRSVYTQPIWYCWLLGRYLWLCSNGKHKTLCTSLCSPPLYILSQTFRYYHQHQKICFLYTQYYIHIIWMYELHFPFIYTYQQKYVEMENWLNIKFCVPTLANFFASSLIFYHFPLNIFIHFVAIHYIQCDWLVLWKFHTVNEKSNKLSNAVLQGCCIAY